MQRSDIAVRTAAATAIGVLYQTCGLRVISDAPLAHTSQDTDSGIAESSSEASLDTQEAVDMATAAHVDGSSCCVGYETREVLQQGLQDILKQIGDLVSHRCVTATLQTQGHRVFFGRGGRICNLPSVVVFVSRRCDHS
jgi:hypothetical protein